jgi:hypothetical protein
MPSSAACVAHRVPSFMLLRATHARHGCEAVGFAHQSLSRSRALCSLPLLDSSRTSKNKTGRLSCCHCPHRRGQTSTIASAPDIADRCGHSSVFWHELFATRSRPWGRFRALQNFPYLCCSRGWPMLTALSICQSLYLTCSSPLQMQDLQTLLEQTKIVSTTADPC